MEGRCRAPETQSVGRFGDASDSQECLCTSYPRRAPNVLLREARPSNANLKIPLRLLRVLASSVSNLEGRKVNGALKGQGDPQFKHIVHHQSECAAPVGAQVAIAMPREAPW